MLLNDFVFYTIDVVFRCFYFHDECELQIFFVFFFLSYEITPDKKYKKSTANDYGIDELRSDDSTDDDEAPRKVVPQWAKGK